MLSSGTEAAISINSPYLENSFIFQKDLSAGVWCRVGLDRFSWSTSLLSSRRAGYTIVSKCGRGHICLSLSSPFLSIRICFSFGPLFM